MKKINIKKRFPLNISKGFTLIELLVVIAIIGILVSVVLVSLNTARSKGSDAAVKANLVSIRPIAELNYDDFGCYTNSNCSVAAFARASCTGTASGDAHIFGVTKVAEQLSAAMTAGALSSCASLANGTAWAVAVQYKSSPSKAWCIDSTGVSKEMTVASPYTQTRVDNKIDVNTALCN